MLSLRNTFLYNESDRNNSVRQRFFGRRPRNDTKRQIFLHVILSEAKDLPGRNEESCFDRKAGPI